MNHKYQSQGKGIPRTESQGSQGQKNQNTGQHMQENIGFQVSFKAQLMLVGIGHKRPDQQGSVIAVTFGHKDPPGQRFRVAVVFPVKGILLLDKNGIIQPGQPLFRNIAVQPSCEDGQNAAQNPASRRALYQFVPHGYKNILNR